MSRHCHKEDDEEVGNAPRSTRIPPQPEYFSVLTQQEKAELRGQEFRGRIFDGFDLAAADLSFATFVGCSLVGCNFRKSDLRHTRFERCDLRWSVFDGARLGKNRFDGSSLGGVSGLRRNDVGYARRHGALFTLDAPRMKAADDDEA
jgi:hypothetical protein